MAKVRILIPTGYGENCAAEAAHAFALAGGYPQIAHINDILSGKVKLHDYHIFNWGGGFLDGDDLGCAKAGANRLALAKVQGGGTLQEELMRFKGEGKLIGGQCNGFQLWAKSGLLPGLDEGQAVSLCANASGKFEDRWVNLVGDPKSPCIWTKGIKSLFLPVRHGEGRLCVSPGPSGKDILSQLRKKHLVPLRYATSAGKIATSYPDNPNGSLDAIAALCDESGQVFALMPHPEAFVSLYQHPFWTRLKSEAARKGKKLSEEGSGLAIFKNAVRYARERLA